MVAITATVILFGCEGTSRSGRRAIVIRSHEAIVHPAGLQRVYSAVAITYLVNEFDSWKHVDATLIIVDHDTVVYMYSYNERGNNWIYNTKIKTGGVTAKSKGVLDSAAMAKHGIILFNKKL